MTFISFLYSLYSLRTRLVPTMIKFLPRKRLMFLEISLHQEQWSSCTVKLDSEIPIMNTTKRSLDLWTVLDNHLSGNYSNDVLIHWLIICLFCRGVYIDEHNKRGYFSARAILDEDPTWNQFSYPGTDLIWPGEFVFGMTTPDPKAPTKPYSTFLFIPFVPCILI